ncbi:MAG: 2'-deoxycytidine 5'-triphosphate deaminase [Patescibacteria group bacterium]|nr:2'-deoxycytidine 5'-triphosphate deaminase [Patescibacteria group bacterium]
MVLGPKQLLELVKTQKLVEGLSERELTNPEGAGFDLRLGEVYKIAGKAFLGITERHTADISLVAKYQSQKSTLRLRSGQEVKSQKITIKPGDFFLVKTIESVNMPQNLTASITPRSTTYRSGLFLRSGNVPPGYCGGLIFGLKNEGSVTVEIEMGARFVHIQFSEVKGGGNLYRGQWQGGRVTARKKEKQV